MNDYSRIPRQQIVVRHLSDSDGDSLGEVQGDTLRVWHPVVADVTLTLSSMRAVIERPLTGGTIAENRLMLSAHSVFSGPETTVYGIDVSEGNSDHLVAERLDRNIGIGLTSRTEEWFAEQAMRVPYFSEVFVSTDGWYYNLAESVQLLFDVPSAELFSLYENMTRDEAEIVEIQVAIQHWGYTDKLAAASGFPARNASVIHGYGSRAWLKGWRVKQVLG